MQHQLENEYVQLKIKEHGAELCSLFHKGHGIEYIWKGDPQVWGRHAPVLFPIVGKLKDNAYQLKGESYHLGQHGFARDLVWQLKEKSSDTLQFELHESADTYHKYPFRFQLEVIFKLQAESVSVSYTVKNTGEEAMPFSIGAHPAFNCPLTGSDRFEDYYLEFEREETLSRQLLLNGLRTGKTRLVMKGDKKLQLSRDLFKEDALVFEGVRSQWVALRSTTHSHGLKISFENFPYLGIWTKSESSPFLCIEPWFGVADRLQGQKDILEKEGIRLLAPGDAFSCTYSVSVF